MTESDDDNKPVTIVSGTWNVGQPCNEDDLRRTYEQFGSYGGSSQRDESTDVFIMTGLFDNVGSSMNDQETK